VKEKTSKNSTSSTDPLTYSKSDSESVLNSSEKYKKKQKNTNTSKPIQKSQNEPKISEKAKNNSEFN